MRTGHKKASGAGRRLFVHTEDAVMYFDDVDNCYFVELPDGVYRIGREGHRGIAAHCKVPWVYYERMMEHAPELLTETVHTWWSMAPNEREVVLDTSGQYPVVVGWYLAKASRRAYRTGHTNGEGADEHNPQR